MPSDIIINENGQIRRVEDVEWAEKVLKLRNRGDHWAVIDELVRVWTKRAPEEVDAMMVNLKQYRESQADQEYGQTLGGKDQERRFTLAFPQTLMLLIRTQYKAEELPFDNKFFREFAKRYPSFKVAQKV